MDIGSNVTSTGPYIETVRSLHQTVTALRTALEESKKEILLLKNKVWPIETIEQSLTALAIENHVLRRKLLENKGETELPNKEQVDLTNLKNESVIDFVPSSKTVEEDENLKRNTEESSQETVIGSHEDSASSAIANIFESHLPEVPSDITLKVSEPHENEQKVYLEESNLEKSAGVLEEKTFKSERVEECVFLETPKTDPLKQSKTTNIPDKEKAQSNLVDIRTNKVREVCFSDNLSKAPLTDSKKAKKEKRNSKKQLTAALRHKSVQKSRIRASVQIKARTFDEKKHSKSLDSLTILKTPSRQLKFSKSTHFLNLNSKISCEISEGFSNMSENSQANVNKYETNEDNQSTNNVGEKSQHEPEQEPEVDDIELIFTTDDTKDSDFKEQLVSIESVERQNNASIKLLVPDQEQSVDISDRELDDDVFDGSFDQDNQEGNALHVFQLERDNSQLYNSKSDNSINQEERSLRSYYSYQDSSFENKSMEKDESFDRFEERVRIVETDISKVGITEVDYAGIRRNTCPNPLQYRPLLHREAINKGLNVKKSRPILAHSNAIRRESGAQTDISALPGSAWRSESSLANKANLGDNFTTLPSKFPLPGSRLKLSEKTTVEARRVLLSDIGFTSMVPELSRSADHLCPTLKPPVTTYGQFLRTPELYSPAFTSQRFTWTTTTASPSDGSHSHSRYSMNPLTPPVQTRRCSAPVSPSRRGTLKSTTSRVRFANGSLPELRGDWTQMTADSGDSTDSLVEEAENYLRRSIDCILGTSKVSESDTKRYILRRASAPESAGDNTPPQGWQPFLPRQPRDLKPDHWVKVITPEGKVKGGRVRYIGPVASQVDPFVGVQLAVPEGHSDGTYNTRRYFQCEPYHGIFVPFKKVIMGWRP